MTEEQWEALVRRLDREAKANPGGYRRRVALLAALGYGYVFAVVAVLVAAAALVVWGAIAGPAALLKFLIPIGALVVVIVRSLWVRLPPPEGIELSRADVPELWRLLDDIRRRTGGPKLHVLLLDGDLNAGIVQIPRLGPLGWYRNYMVIGLPLLHALSPEEFVAVIAHEFGHLSKRHGRLTVAVYRLRETWARLLGRLEAERHWGQFLFRRFLSWYVPYFNAYSFALARAHEYEADRTAAEATNPLATGSALASVKVAGRYLADDYWPSLYRRAETDAYPPQTAFSPLAERLPGARRAEEAPSWLQAALSEPTGVADTHPALAERLGALGVDAADVVAAARGDGRDETAATRFLADAEARLAALLDRDWLRAVEPHWRSEHAEAQAARRLLAELDDRAARGEELTADERRTRAFLVERFRSEDEALALLQELLARERRDPAADFALGRILLGRGDETGLVHLEKAMADDPDAILPATELAYDFLRSHGRTDEAERYRERAAHRGDELELAYAERSDPQDRGEDVPHELPDDVVAETQRQLAAHPDVKRAFLVRRRMRHLDDELPLYVLYVMPRRRPWRPFGGDRAKLVRRVAESLDLPFMHWIFSPAPRSVRHIPRALVFEG
jgi:Zn-dependent protease with chaperone function